MENSFRQSYKLQCLIDYISKMIKYDITNRTNTNKCNNTYDHSCGSVMRDLDHS